MVVYVIESYKNIKIESSEFNKFRHFCFNFGTSMSNPMGGAHLHTPPSIFQHLMGQHNISQQGIHSWMQIPQVPPISMPWSIPVAQQPEVIRFHGEMSQSNFGSSLHQKRKLAPSDLLEPGRPAKQFITEEKMTAHFQNMHISPNYHFQTSSASTSMGNTESNVSETSRVDLSMEGSDLIQMEPTKSTHPRLIFSKELKELKREPILPASLLSKLHRPSMALVLWEPNKHLRALPILRDTSTPMTHTTDENYNNDRDNRNNANSNQGIFTNNNNSSINNNNEGIPDLNQSQNSNSILLEPMDL